VFLEFFCESVGNGTGTPTDCTRHSDHFVSRDAKLSAIGVTVQAIFERLYFVPGVL